MKQALSLLTLLICSLASAQESIDTSVPAFSKQDTARELVLDSFLLADYAQTLNIKKSPYLSEHNKLLGKHPSDVAVTAYFAGAIVGHYYVAKALPQGWPRATWQYGWIAVEAWQVVRNRRVQMAVQF